MHDFSDMEDKAQNEESSVKRKIKRPKYLDDYHVGSVTNNFSDYTIHHCYVLNVPNTYEEAMTHKNGMSEKRKWKVKCLLWEKMIHLF